MTSTTPGTRPGTGRWFLRSAIRYVLLFAVLWVSGGSLASLLTTGEVHYASTRDELGLVLLGALIFCLVGAPSLVVIPLVGRLRKRESFRPVATAALLLPILLVLAGGGGSGVLVLVVIQVAFGAWLMPRE
ncbi:hypothetical protein [Kitasatospora phosalacinea]|uniref:Uncharacterized protein n=1 Tax=Kitasatospora phosalacinea TaxID=2065 RepID=A0A9W6PHS4_9ACTN|nr:hypothetical protein [Kitasatospora phosalacinea]GLW56394.1 hypothetical protein Kpho01_44050 [Kitasatospora phosalacinea]